MKQKIILVGFLLILFYCFLPGCQEPAVEVDLVQLNLVDQYVEELTTALLFCIPDLLGWNREPYSDNMPLKYKGERITLLKGHQDNIEHIKDIRESTDFPSEELIAKWQVVIVRGDDEWMLEGAEVVEALRALDLLSGRVEQTIEAIASNDGVLNMEQSEAVVALTDELATAVEEIRVVFYR